MNILITGAEGFLGKNLCAALKNIRDGKDKTRPALKVDAVMEYGRHTEPQLLERYCRTADFVFHLAGVNRAQTEAEFFRGNEELTRRLLACLKRQGNHCPVAFTSSVRASCTQVYDDAYGQSKRAAEELLFAYGRETDASVMVYRLCHVFGKWSRPHYNSVVATFCHDLSRGLPIRVDDPDAPLTLLYIDDLVAQLLDALTGQPHRGEDGFCALPVTYATTVGALARMIGGFSAEDRRYPAAGSAFAQKLYATYLSFLPPERIALPLTMHKDVRGSFTRLPPTPAGGQIGICVCRPGQIRGRHWHHSKWEIFTVVSGAGEIRMRQVGTAQVLRFAVGEEALQLVTILPGYTHELVNLSETRDLVAVVWASEIFDPQRPDTFSEDVE